MKIDIDSLNYDELVELNHKIVERLKFLDQMHAHREMMQFSPGDQVSFEPPGRNQQFGTLSKYNKKTVTVITESGQKWNVSPHLLRKIKNVKNKKDNKGRVINLPEK
jgi:ribosomal protein S17